MVFPDIPEVESGCTFSRDGGVHRNKVHAFSYAVDDVHNRVVTMGFRQFNNEVDTDHIPWCFWSLRGMELTEGSSMLYFSPVTQITVLNVDADVTGHLWPPIITGYQLEGLKVACMSGNACIVVLFDDTTPKVSVIGDIDLAAEHE
jgi:hypothetical protein